MSLLDSAESALFEHFLNHRRLKDRAIDLLKEVKEQHDLKSTDIRTAKNLTYKVIAANLLEAVEQSWLPLDQLIALLDESEIAGKQHICIFRLPSKGAAKVFDAIASPTTLASGVPSLADFVEVPDGSSARILEHSAMEVTVKIVTKRAYWIQNLLKDEPERQLLEKLIHRERAAVIVRCSKQSNLVQIRIPPREKGPSETARAVYDFAIQTLKEHYDVGKSGWIHQVHEFPIADSYNAVLKNKDDFKLWYDTPEDQTTKSRISGKGRPNHEADLRKEKTWKFDGGYARNSIRGFWSTDSQPIYVHMNADTVRISPSEERSFARLFVPSLCTDEDLDHVITKIDEHI